MAVTQPVSQKSFALADLAVEWLTLAAHSRDRAAFLPEALAACRRLGLRTPVAVYGRYDGAWREMAASDNMPGLPPSNLLAEVADRGVWGAAGPWTVVPLTTPAAERPRGHVECLAVNLPDTDAGQTQKTVVEVARLLGAVLSLLATSSHAATRVRRLSAILEIASQWTQSFETESLLTQMAQTAARLTGCERASVFIWDRPRKSLVARPALGLDGGELRLPDDRGVVGRCLASGEVIRISEREAATAGNGSPGQPAAAIDRATDKKTGFTTRNLLCAPLIGSRGQTLGVFELLNKSPGDFSEEDAEALTELAGHAALALEKTRELEGLLRRKQEDAEQAARSVQLIGESPAVERVRRAAGRVARTDLAVLVLGPNGSGKEVLSRLIHFQSDRAGGPWLAVNCASLTETLLESELFGHEKGAFTDAAETRAGKFEAASGGTLLLDEIGDLSPGGQAKLLRAMEEKVVVRVGGVTPIATDVRVIAATNQDLTRLVEEKRFREDLFFRLNVVTLEMPPLAERGDDVILLAEHFLTEFSSRARRKTPRLTPAAKGRLRAHTWPGNVRELRNLMERLAYLLDHDDIDADDLSFIMAPGRGRERQDSLDQSLAEATKAFQQTFIRRQIDAATGNMTQAADRLGLHRSNLYRKMRQLGMDA